jgi:hypothetical protein
MKIELKATSENSEINNDTKFTIDDDGFEGRGWVSIGINDKYYDLHITDLFPAVKAFYDADIERLKRDKLL